MASKGPHCNEWHSRRRRALLILYPEIKTILRNDRGKHNPFKNLVFVILAQMFCVLLLSELATAHGFAWTLGLCLLLSSTLGAWLMFLAQALIHDCSHQESMRKPAIFAAIVADMLYCDTGPCFALYYFKYHLMHHKVVGSYGDSCIPASTLVSRSKTVDFFNSWKISMAMHCWIVYNGIANHSEFSFIISPDPQ